MERQFFFYFLSTLTHTLFWVFFEFTKVFLFSIKTVSFLQLVDSNISEFEPARLPFK